MREDSARVGWPALVAFGAPAVGAGYMYLLLSLYVMKFATDVLLIAPAVMGLIFSVSRLWDAVSDPLVGYLSDRTRLRLGRRRSWILGGVIPISALYAMVFMPPGELSGTAIVVWMAVAVIGFYSAMTVFFVPHMSLGAELTDNYHERTRLFGMRHAFYTGGSILSLVSMQFLINAEQASEAAVREVAQQHAIIAITVTALLMLFAVYRLREPRQTAKQPSASPFSAYRDVLANPYARRLYIVWFIENVGGAAIGALTLYVTQYVVGAPTWAPAIILAYMLPSTFAVPFWLALSRRLGKIRAWVIGMLGTGVSFGAMMGLLLLDTVEQRLWLIFTMALTAGFSAAAGGSIGPSVQGDVIDYDELQTGERKEGSYYAAWNFIYKSALGAMLLLTGFALEAAGFVPNQVQSEVVQKTMLALYGFAPLVCYVTGALLFVRFPLTEAVHGRIRADLDGREDAQVEGG